MMGGDILCYVRLAGASATVYGSALECTFEGSYRYPSYIWLLLKKSIIGMHLI